MKKTMEILPVKNQDLSGLNISARITSCAQVIYQTHSYLARYGARISAVSRQKSMKILNAAETELSRLLAVWKQKL